jgi:hypothetical protein
MLDLAQTIYALHLEGHQTTSSLLDQQDMQCRISNNKDYGRHNSEPNHVIPERERVEAKRA